MVLRRLVALFVVAGLTSLFISEGGADLAAQDTDKKLEKKKGMLKKLFEKKGEDSKKSDEPKKVEPFKQESKVKPPVVPEKALVTKEVAVLIDREITGALEKAKLTASERCSDDEFLRRVSLDITGVIPSSEQAKAFLDSKDPAKRAKLVEDLLAAPSYGQRQADIWLGLMYPVDSDNRFVTKDEFAKWLREQFNTNKHWDKLVSELLTATGEQEEHPEVTYFMANRGVDKMTDSVSKLFLGLQLQCAQCHNHPFTSWKQNEYWGMAQFFYKVSATVSRPNAATKGGNSAVVESGNVNRRMNPLPDSAKTVTPKFLGGNEVKLDKSEPYRPVLAKWITAPSNPYFAKAMVNRTWAQFFGRGFVNPVDDMLEENEASHPELLMALSGQFIASNYDVKELIRGICASESYQRSSKPTSTNKEDKTHFSHQAMKTLTPEQAYDSITMVIGAGGDTGRPAPKGMLPKGGNVTPRDRFVSFFLPGDSAKPTEYETGIPQVLRLMNATRLNSSPALIREISREKPELAIEKLYLKVLSRYPTPEETTKMKEYAAKQSNSATAYSDILWVLINTSEFALNR